jgi:ATP-dependent DNA helicase RecQ
LSEAASPSAQASSPELETHLAKFGLTAFRPGQREVVSAVIDGHDCLCIMPTGGGKSLCFQLPAVSRGGVTLVVSPLIALMKDQVDSLLALNLRATFINSTQSLSEQRERMEGMAAGRYELVYIAPERLRNARFVEAAHRANVKLLAVDEAHCISEWGHDFRPDYARLGKFRARLGSPQTIALTATATPTVREDVIELLSLREPKIFVTGFARPNLRFDVEYANGDADKFEAICSFLKKTSGAGIIYAATRKACEELASELGARIDRRVGLYHAGLAPDERRNIQEKFMSGATPIIAATNAFGMGIDKSDLRFVIHYNMPRSLEAYYQEAGRAGRDGETSTCLLLFNYRDRRIQEFFIDNSYPKREMVAAVYGYLRGCSEDPIEITMDELKERLKLSVGSEGIGACERLLEKAGAIERLDSNQNMAAARIDSALPSLVDLLPRDAKAKRRVLQAVERVVGELRGERVYFSIEQIAAEVEISRDAANRALRELNALPYFNFIPPFRGRAIHVYDRAKRFADFEIDFDELDRRRAAEYEKLERVIAFAQTHGCRQRAVLEYFGDHSLASCGACDNCRTQKKQRVVTGRSIDVTAERAALKAKGVETQPPRAETKPSKPSKPVKQPPKSVAETHGDDSLVEAVRIALSGAARANGRIGKTLLSKMLCGSNSAQMAKLRLDRLSTFGLLRDLKQTEVAELLDALLATGLLEQVETQRFRPMIQTTARGVDVMRGESDLPPTFPISPALRAKLSQRPKSPASAAIMEPAGTPARQQPSPAREKATLPQADFGAGYEEPFEPDWSELSRELDGTSESPAPRSPAPSERPTHYWTWRLRSQGFQEAEIAAIRGLDSSEIRRHLDQAERDREGQD